MAKENLPVTAAIRVLRAAKVDYTPHVYDYEEKGGTSHSAACLGVDEHAVVKTLIMQDDRDRPLVVLMHGDRQVSTKALARHVGAKSIAPCVPTVADRHSGYQVGGTSPFGLKRRMPIYLESSTLALPRIFVNGGRRGLLVELDPRELVRVLQPELVEVATT
jgi:Cys-tRNA(Pro) deacylase